MAAEREIEIEERTEAVATAVATTSAAEVWLVEAGKGGDDDGLWMVEGGVGCDGGRGVWKSESQP